MPDSAVGRAWRNFANTINAGVNAATGGYFNRGVGAIMGATREQVDRANQEMRAQTGTMGDIADGLGSAALIGRGLKLAGGAVQAARAAPTAVALARSAGPGTAARFLAGRAGPGLVPVAAPMSRVAQAKAAGSVIGKVGLVGLPIALSVADGRDDQVTTSKTGVGPQGKYTQEQLDARKAYLAERANKPFADDPNHIDLTDPVTRALMVGRSAPAAISPQQRQVELLSTILNSPKATLSDLQAVTSMMPAPARPRTAKDTAFGQTAELSRQIFENQMSSIAAQKDAGDITAEQAQAMTAEAMNAEFQRQSGMQGLNPMNLLQAQMMAPDEEE